MPAGPQEYGVFNRTGIGRGRGRRPTRSWQMLSRSPGRGLRDGAVAEPLPTIARGRPSRSSAARARSLAVVAALLFGACATAQREPWVLTTDELRERPLRDLERVSSYQQALATALDIMQRDLGLPELEARLLFLPDSKRFKAVLIRIGYPPGFARDVTREMIALGGHRVVLINQRRLEREHGGWPGRVGFLAHELGHVLQYAVGGGTRGTSAQWLREGFAEWLEARVLEAPDRADGAKARSRAILRVRTHSQARVMSLGGPNPLAEFVEQAQGPARLPALADLGSWPDWVVQSRSSSGPILPDYAFVAVSLLIERHGVPAVVRYFALFAERQDPAANFLEAFAEPEAQFEQRLRRVVGP